MALLKTGTVAVTNGSNIVTGTGTSWLTQVQVGNSFKIAGEDAIYAVISVDSNTQVTLNVNYAGATASEQAYSIGRDFTPDQGIPETDASDPDLPYRMTEAMRKIDSLITLANAGNAGLFQIDIDGGLMPITGVAPDDQFELDGSDNIIPKA